MAIKRYGQERVSIVETLSITNLYQAFTSQPSITRDVKNAVNHLESTTRSTVDHSQTNKDVSGHVTDQDREIQCLEQRAVCLEKSIPKKQNNDSR